MKLSRSLFAAALLACSPLALQPAHAQMRPLNDPVVAHPDPESLFTSSDPVLHRNKQVSLKIIKELLEAGHWEERAPLYLTERYIQHNPLAASGLDAVIHYFVNVAKVEPKPIPEKTEYPIVAVQAEGDYVTVLTRREMPVPGIPGETYTTTWFDTWRFVDGKADQHWDPATLPAVQAAASAAPASGGGMALAQQEADRAAIERLMWNYVRAADTLDAEKYVNVFTENGAFQNTKGRAALHKMISDLKTGQDQRRDAGQLSGDMHHVMSNQSIEFLDPDHARVHYYWMTVFGGPAGTTPEPNVAAVGHGVDDVVKVNGQWLIANRNVSPAG